MDLHVMEGEVATKALEGPQASGLYTAGQSQRFSVGENDVAAGAGDTPPRFREVVASVHPKQRPDLMSVHESFRYEVGYYSPKDLGDGMGWNGPWRLLSDEERGPSRRPESSQTMEIVQSQLKVPWPIDGGRWGQLQMPPGLTIRARELAEPIDLATDQVVYFSMMTSEPMRPTNGKAESEAIRLTLRDSNNFMGPNLGFGMGQGEVPYINCSPGSSAMSPVSVPAGRSRVWVGKIICRSVGEDEISLRVYSEMEHLDFAEPSVWHVVSHGLDQHGSFGLLVLTSAGTGSRIVDEIRFGPTWRSVVPYWEGS
jgi:hypothetical protein